MRTAFGGVGFILHHASKQQAQAIAALFAVRTEKGWRLPAWCERFIESAYTAQELQQLRQQAQRRDV